MPAAAAEVESCRKELLQLRSTVQTVQSEYKTVANARVACQKKMAQMVQTVQQRSTNDVPLVEDVICVSLQAETAASQSQSGTTPQAPIIDSNNQPGGRTASAEEAIAVYKSQIETLQLEHTYRAALLQSEKSLVKIYNQGMSDIVETVHEYCGDQRLVQEIDAMST